MKNCARTRRLQLISSRRRRVYFVMIGKIIQVGLYAQGRIAEAVIIDTASGPYSTLPLWPGWSYPNVPRC